MENETLLTTEEVVEEAVGEVVGEVIEAVTDEVCEEPAPAEKVIKKYIINGIISFIVLLAVAAGIFFTSFYNEYKHLGFEGVFSSDYNKYNHMGILDITGKTVGEICENTNYDYNKFLDDFDLPADMPASTHQNAFEAMMPVGTYAQWNFTDFATMKKKYNFPEYVNALPLSFGEKVKALFGKYTAVPVTEDTPWGAIMNSLTLSALYGENFEAAKAQYGFGESVTGDTLYGEVRREIEKKLIANLKEHEKALEAAGTEGEPENSETVDDATAEGTAE